MAKDDKKEPGQPSNPSANNPIPLPPIPIFLAPSISSISPAGAVIGAAGFVLTVNGFRFNTTSVVQWKQSARITTFVSTTQLTAAILPGDMTVGGDAAVQVVNAIGASNVVNFRVVPNINDILTTLNQAAQSFTTIDQFLKVQPSIIQAIADLRTYLSNEDTTINTLQSQLTDAQNQVANLTSQNASLNATISQQSTTIAQLQAQLAATKSSTARPVDVAQSFKGVVDQVQQAARDSGGVQTTLTNLSVQIKALMNVQQPSAAALDAGGSSAPEAVLVFPDPTALPDPNTLSTVTFSFSAIPNLKSATPAPPPAPAPVPAPSPAAAAAPAPAPPESAPKAPPPQAPPARRPSKTAPPKRGRKP